MKIYYYRDHYADRRNIIDIIPNAEYADVTKSAYFTPVDSYKPELYTSFYAQRVDNADALCHFFNYINIGDSEFITTFESWLPRKKNNKYANKSNVQILLNILSSDRCKAIIAISACAHALQRKFLEKNAMKIQDELISAKLHLLHPPQRLITSQPNEIEDCINFIFIGHDFFRKGGFEILSAFDELSYSFSNFKLYIISRLNLNNRFNVTHSLSTELKIANMAVRNRPYVVWYESLPYDEVLQLLSRCHVGLLPSYFDTYGYSILEMQAAGIPVISTSLRAFPEINSQTIGWMIDLDQEIGCASPTELAMETRKMVQRRLTEIIANILQEPDCITRRGRLCLERIKAMHDPDIYAANLARIYALKAQS